VDKITEYTSKVIFWTFFNWWNLDPRNWKYASPYELTWFGGTFMGALPYWFDQLEMCEWNDTYLLEKRQVKAMTMDKADFFTLFIPSVSGFLGPIQGFYEWFSGSDDEESEGGGGAKSLIGALIDKLELPESIPVINVKTEDLLSPFAYILQFIFDLFSDEDIDFVKLFTEPLPDCVFEEQGGGAGSGGYEPEELHHFTYVVAIKSKPGMFLKVFGPTIGEKKPYRDNVPITWAFATVAIKGHHIYPGGLYRTPGFLTGEGDDPFTEIQTMVVPYFIASWPPLTQLRLIMPSQDYTYQGDWKATLIPVKFRFSIRELLLSIPIINLDKPFLAKVDADVDGKYLGFNH
jgi:hypothetical protein